MEKRMPIILSLYIYVLTFKPCSGAQKFVYEGSLKSAWWLDACFVLALLL